MSAAAKGWRAYLAGARADRAARVWQGPIHADKSVGAVGEGRAIVALAAGADFIWAYATRSFTSLIVNTGWIRGGATGGPDQRAFIAEFNIDVRASVPFLSDILRGLLAVRVDIVAEGVALSVTRVSRWANARVLHRVQVCMKVATGGHERNAGDKSEQTPGNADFDLRRSRAVI